MAKTVEFLFDVGSPTSYLAWAQLPGLVQRTGAGVHFVPVLLSGIYSGSGNASPKSVPAKRAYKMAEAANFAKRYSLPFQENPHPSLSTLLLMRAITGAQMAGKMADVLSVAFKAMWVDGVKVDDPNVLEELAEAAGVGIDQFAHWVSDDGVKAQLRANTDHAIERGVFDVPTFFVDDEMFYGQDRMNWVEEALQR